MKKTKRVYGVLLTLFLVCFLLMTAVIVLKGPTAWDSLWMLLGTVLYVAAAIVVAVFCARCRIPHFGLILFLGGFALQCALVFLYQPPIESDFAILYDAAQQWSRGITDFQQTGYFSNWAYQSAFVGFEAALLRIWNDPMFLRIVNSLLSSATVWLLYRFLSGRVKPGAAKAAAVLCLLFPLRLLLPMVLTNQILSAFFFVLGINLLAYGRGAPTGAPEAVTARSAAGQLVRAALAGVCLQLGNVFRPEGLIVLVAVLAFAVFFLLEHRGAKQNLAMLLCLAALLGCYRGTYALADRYVRESGLNAYGLENRNPYWKFVIGLNAETGGAYSQADAEHLSVTQTNAGITDTTLTSEKTIIRERLSAGAPVLAKLAWHKIGTQWVVSAMQWIVGPYDDMPENTFYQGPAAKMLIGGERGMFYLALLCAAFGLIRRRKTISSAELLPYFVMFAAFCALLVVEVQARYAYLPQLFLFTATAYGSERIGKEPEHE